MRPILSVAGNLKHPEVLQRYREVGADEVFFGPGTLFGSGRTEAQKTDENELATFVGECKRVGLATAILLNPACTGNREFSQEGAQAIVEMCNWINEYEIDWVTIGNPWFVNVFKELCPDVKIKISSHYHCDSIGKYDLFLDKLGVDMVVVPAFANKNFKLLREVAKRWGGERLEVMCTVPCITGCPYQTWHAPATAHGSQHWIPDSCDFPCHHDYATAPHVVVSSFFVRREDMRFYQELGIHTFKIGERFKAPELNVACIEYFRGGAREGLSNLLWPRGTVIDIDTDKLDGFYEVFFNEQCDGTKYNCTDCNHCIRYGQEAVVYGENHEAELGKKRLASHKGMFDGYVDLLNQAMGMSETEGQGDGAAEGEAKTEGELPHVHDGETCGCMAEE